MLTRRASILTDKVFQYRFCFYAISWIFALSLLYPIVITQVFAYFLQIAQAKLPDEIVNQLKDTRGNVVRIVILFHVVFLAMVGLTNLFLSHRIAGPLYKLKRTFQECRPGNIVRSLSFRKYDYFPELAHEYTAMMTSIDDRREAAIGLLENALPGASGETRSAIQAALLELKASG